MRSYSKKVRVDSHVGARASCVSPFETRLPPEVRLDHNVVGKERGRSRDHPGNSPSPSHKGRPVDEIIQLDKENRRRQLELGSMRKELDKIKSTGPRLGVDNVIIGAWGTERSDPNLKSQAELVKLLDAANCYRDLRLAFNNFLMTIVKGFGCKTSNSVFFTRKDPGGKYFLDYNRSSEGLFEVICEGGINYAIPNCGYPFGKSARSFEIPDRYILYRSSLQEEVVAHGYARSSFHDIDKVEQLCITDQNINCKMLKMYMNGQIFYRMLNIPFRIVSIGSDALGDVVVKFIIKGWFPASQAYVELASCSMYKVSDILYNGKKRNEDLNECACLVHSIAVPERTVGCILENNQREAGIDVPNFLRSNMHGKSFLPFMT